MQKCVSLDAYMRVPPPELLNGFKQNFVLGCCALNVCLHQSNISAILHEAEVKVISSLKNG
jgi:hypothetical protein